MLKFILLILLLFTPTLFIQNTRVEFLHFVYIYNGFSDIQTTDSEGNLVNDDETFTTLMNIIFASICDFEMMIKRATKKAIDIFQKKLDGALKKLRFILKTIETIIIFSFRKFIPFITSKLETPSVTKIAIGFLTFSSVYLSKTYPLRC